MTNNGQTPGGNTTTAAQMAMARRIADELIPNPENESVVYKSFHQTAERAALAAIIETTEAAAKWAEHRVGVGLTNLAADYRNNDHLRSMSNGS